MSNSTPQPRPAKAMSSRLMTMKFMQRAAASTPASAPQSQPQIPETPPSKRQKTSNNAPSTATPPSDLQLIRSALDEEEQKRQKALERLAEEAGETKWVLSTVNGGAEAGKTGLRVAKAGYSDIDQDAWTPAGLGRRSFGKFNKELEKRQDGTSEGSSTSSDEDSEASKEDVAADESDDQPGTRELIRAAEEEATKRAKAESSGRKQQRRAEKAELVRLVEKRRTKEVKLNRLSSISGGGGGGGSKPKGDGECFTCGEKGHKKVDCPQKRNRSHADGPGRDLKRYITSLNY